MVERNTGKLDFTNFIKNHGVNLLYILLIPLAFWIIFGAVVYIRTGYTLSDHIFWYSDVSSYYLLISGILRSGIFSDTMGSTGYLFYWEGITALNVARHLFYGAHGIFILLPYIFFGSFLGFNGVMPLFIGLLLLIIAFYFVYFSCYSLKQTIFVQLAIFLFLPFLFHFPTLFMDTQMHAWGIILMALLYKYRLEQKNRTGLFFLFAVFFASLARITNLVFIIPYFFIEIENWTKKDQNEIKKNKIKGIIFGIITILLSLVVFLVSFSLLTPSFYTSQIGITMNAFSTGSIIYGLRTVIFNILFNVLRFIYPRAFFLDLFVRIGISLLAVTFLLYSLFTYDKKKFSFKFNHELFSIFFMIFVITFFIISVYEVGYGRDFRLLSPILSAVIVYIILRYKDFLIITEISVGYVLFGIFFMSFVLDPIDRNFGQFYINDWARYISYDPYAENRLENSVLIHYNWQNETWDLDHGLGLIFDMTGTNFEYYQAAQHGIVHLIRPAKSDNAYPWYQVVAYGHDWVVYRLRK